MVHFAGFGEGSAICISDADRRILFTNEKHLGLLGRSSAGVVGRDWRGFMTSEGAGAVLPQFQSFWRTRQPYDVLTHMLRADGTMLPVVARCTAIRGGTAGFDLLLCEMQTVEAVLRDVTSDRFVCANFVRDLTYEMARLTGRSRFADLTNALLEASASAERAVEMLANAAADLPA